jgi:hypothetical protein
MLKLAFGMLAARQLRDRQRDQPIVSVRQHYDLTLLKVSARRRALWRKSWERRGPAAAPLGSRASQ